MCVDGEGELSRELRLYQPPDFPGGWEGRLDSGALLGGVRILISTAVGLRQANPPPLLTCTLLSLP